MTKKGTNTRFDGTDTEEQHVRDFDHLIRSAIFRLELAAAEYFLFPDVAGYPIEGYALEEIRKFALSVFCSHTRRWKEGENSEASDRVKFLFDYRLGKVGETYSQRGVNSREYGDYND